jgi:hypothetical protein
MGGNFPINANSTVEQYEHIQAISVGIGTTYSLVLNQKDVESCPQKYEIFKAIRTWENARAANAFPRTIKKLLADPNRNWRLQDGENQDTWILYELKENGSNTSYVLQRKES